MSSTAQILGNVKAKRTDALLPNLERKARQAHVYDVCNLHATLIERGKNASLIQRGVSKAENEMKA